MLAFGQKKKGGIGRSGTNTSEESILKDEGIRKTMETVVDFEQRSMRGQVGDERWVSARGSKVM
jgi:hypothetical protein